MKTSNYILIAFFVFLFGGIFLLFLTSKHHKAEVPQWKSSEKPLDDFSVVVAEPGARFQVKIGDTTKLQINYKLPDTLSYPKSYVRNDTLFMFPWEGKIQSKQLDKGLIIRYNNMIVYARQLHSIIGKENSDIELYELTPDTLNINANRSRIICIYQKPERPKGLTNIIASGKSYIKIDNLSVQNVKLDLTQSHLIFINSTIKKLTGPITNHSILAIQKLIPKINLDMDSTSKFNFASNTTWTRTNIITGNKVDSMFISYQ